MVLTSLLVPLPQLPCSPAGQIGTLLMTCMALVVTGVAAAAVSRGIVSAESLPDEWLDAASMCDGSHVWSTDDLSVMQLQR